jgi:hypothetical protein
MSKARPTWARLVREPLVQFLVIGAALFAVRHWVVGEPRTIVVGPTVKAELVRRFEDQNGRKPDASELERALRSWERDEALYREALREPFDRGDLALRTLLIGKIHERVGLEVPKHDPTDAELRAWLAAHRDRYETPLRYDFEFIAFSKADAGSAKELEQYERAIADGKNPALLGRPVVGGDLTLRDMKDRVEPELSAKIPELTLGQWQRVEGQQMLWLTRLKHVEGGLPSFDELRPSLSADFSSERRRAEVERIEDGIVGRYRFEAQP